MTAPRARSIPDLSLFAVTDQPAWRSATVSQYRHWKSPRAARERLPSNRYGHSSMHESGATVYALEDANILSLGSNLPAIPIQSNTKTVLG
jgi:hypothetical protein